MDQADQSIFINRYRLSCTNDEGVRKLETIRITYPSAPSSDVHPSMPQVIAIGDFDGVHLGHQQVIRRAADIASSLNTTVSVMTFHPHPREVLGQDKYAQSITPLDMKLSLLGQLGVDRAYVISFDTEFSRMPPEMFIEQILKPLQVHTVVVGFDFTFGYQGRGNATTLRELGSPDLDVEVVPPYHLEGQKVSSTFVREQLMEGNIPQVNAWLGREFSITGQVVRGDGRGRTIGFPTANIQLDKSFVIPRTGVYAVEVEVKGQVRSGVMNIGYKPTFTTDNKLSLEVHILDFNEDIYGEQIAVRFHAFIRGERKFPSIEQLIAQIRQDAEWVREQKPTNVS